MPTVSNSILGQFFSASALENFHFFLQFINYWVFQTWRKYFAVYDESNKQRLQNNNEKQVMNTKFFYVYFLYNLCCCRFPWKEINQVFIALANTEETSPAFLFQRPLTIWDLQACLLGTVNPCCSQTNLSDAVGPGPFVLTFVAETAVVPWDNLLLCLKCCIQVQFCPEMV